MAAHRTYVLADNALRESEIRRNPTPTRFLRIAITGNFTKLCECEHFPNAHVPSISTIVFNMLAKLFIILGVASITSSACFGQLNSASSTTASNTDD